MKRKRLFTNKYTILVILIVIYKLLKYILKINNLAFTNITFYTFIVILIVLLLSILIQVIKVLYYIIKKKTIKLWIRSISGIGIAIVTTLIIIFVIYGGFVFVFTYEPEHIVEKDGKKMVARVYSFVQVQVNYYDYINLFVRGNKLKINEDYGNGGYDPFKRDEMPSVRSYIYFDDNGKVIKTNWEN